MKFRRTVSSVVASVFLVVAVLLVVVQLRLATFGMEKVRQIIRSFLPSGNTSIEVSVDGMESTLMKSLKVNNLRASVEGKEFASAGNIEVSLTLWDVLKLALGKGAGNLDVTVNDLTVTVDDGTVNSLMAAVGQLSTGSAQASDSPAGNVPAKAESTNPILDMGISASVRNLGIHASYMGFEVDSEGINASARFGSGFSLEGAELNIPELGASGKALDGNRAVFKDIRASVGSDLVAYVSVQSGSYADTFLFSELSAIAQLQDKLVSAALFVKEGRSSVPVNGSAINVLVSGTTISANYSLSDSQAGFSSSIEDIGVSSDDMDLNIEIRSLGLDGVFDGKDVLSLDMGIRDISGSLKKAEIGASDLNMEAGFVFGSQSSLGQLSLGRVGLYTSADSVLRSLWAEGSILDYSYSKQGLSVRFRTVAGGESDDPLIGSFGFSFDSTAQSRNFKGVSNASIAIQDIVAASVTESASINLDLDEVGNTRLGIRIGDCLTASADYAFDSGETLLNIYITDLAPSSFKVPYERFLSSVKAIGEDTLLNGNVVISVTATEAFAAYVKALHEGESAQLEMDSPFDAISSGRISVNTALSNLHVGASPVGGALTLEATVDESLAHIESLAVSAGGVRVSYAGTIDLSQLVPDGVLLLQKTSDGSTLASLTFSYEKGEREHTFLFESPLLKEASISGNVNWADLSNILMDGSISAPFFPQDRRFSASFSPNPLKFLLSGEYLDLDVALDSGVITVLGSVNDLVVKPNENTEVVGSTGFSARIDTQQSGFVVDLTDFSVLISDSFAVGFDLSLTDHSLFLTNLRLGKVGQDETYSGAVDLTFSDIASLTRLDTSSLKGTVNLLRTNSRTSLRGAATDNQFYLDFYYKGIGENGLNATLSVLGQRDNALYASASLVWGDEGANRFTFNAQYDDKVFSLYDSYGNMGSLNVDDINLIVDFGRLIVDGSLDFRNERTGRSGETKVQSGKLTISATGPEVSTGMIQAFVGLDYGFDFKLGLSDVSLDDGYTMADTQVDMHLQNGLLSFSGSLVNGSFDIGEGYLDIAVDEDILFGFKAKGYVGKTLDLMVTDLSFPLPILNQFMGEPTFSFTNGLIEGEVLIQGPLSNPSLFGMAYCQSYEMTLFYLPDQIISVKNVALAINDHSLQISRTPLSGYSEADGRYFFGDVAVDIVLQGLGVETFDVSLNIDDDTPIDFWLPMLIGGDFEIRGDVSGYVDFSINGRRPKLTTDIDVSSMLIDFRFDQEMPDWFYNQKQGPPDMDITMTTGHDVEFYYPEKDSPFINFTLAEDRTVRLINDNGTFKTDGGMALKTGQVYYFQNDFIIKEGSVDLSERKFSGSDGGISFVLNLTAEITDYDSDGNKVIISMILQNATLDNLNPRFSSTPAKSENEILAMLGQSVLASGALDRTLSLSSLARFARTARETLTRVGVIESNKNYSITGTVRTALGLDIFSARSNILSNVIIDALPGDLTGRRDISMLARYLDRTSLFAGKYIGDNWFVKVRLMLKADSNVKLSNKVGHFLAKDLILDTEISLDWDTPMGTLSVFTQPRELSVFDILDTIGFSVTKQIQF